MYGFIICDDISMIEIRGGEKASLKLLNFGNPFGTLKNTLVYIFIYTPPILKKKQSMMHVLLDDIR